MNPSGLGNQHHLAGGCPILQRGVCVRRPAQWERLGGGDQHARRGGGKGSDLLVAHDAGRFDHDDAVELEALHRAHGPEREAMIGNALDRTDDILALFGAILRIAELEEGELRKHFAPVALGPLVADLADMHVALAEDSGRVLEEAVCEDCHIVGDRELISQALINLIENAVRHTPPGARILIGSREEGDTCRVFVADNGPGIAQDDRVRVTERFVRLDAARSTAGHGLGLSLVKAIAEAHGGRLELRDRAPGLDASLTFPKEPT